MKVSRTSITNHFRRIMCGEQIVEAVFHDRFATSALSPDLSLLVLAPDLDGAEDLGTVVGLADLPLLTRAFGFTGSEDGEVVVRLDSTRLIIDDGAGGKQRLMTADQKTIATRIEDGLVKKILARVSKKDGVPLTRALINSICATFLGYRASEVLVTVGKNGGIRVGNENGHYADFPSKELKRIKGAAYSLLFGQPFISVLSQVEDDPATMFLGGPDAPIMIVDGDYRYVLSPRQQGEQASKEPAASKEQA